MRGFVFDAGAFIALERRAPLLLGILDEALHGTVQVVLPRTVIAQVWRGSPRQANVGRLISAGRGRDGPVIIDELTAERAKEIGVMIAKTSHPDSGRRKITRQSICRRPVSCQDHVIVDHYTPHRGSCDPR